MKIRRSFRPAVLVFLLILIATACSGESDGDDTTAPESDTTVAAGADETTAAPGDTEAPDETEAPTAVEVQGISDDGVIKVGGWIAQSGPLAIVAEIKDTAQLAFDEVNAAGGVNGYTFEYVAIDDQADPSQTIAAAQALWEEDEVFLYFLPYGSGPNSAVRDYVVDNNIPTLFPFADTRIYFPDGEAPPENVYGFLPPYGDLVRHLVTEAATVEEIETIAVVHTNDDFGQAGPDAVEVLVEELGVEIVDDIGYDAGETNFAPIGRRIAATEADATLMWGIPGSPQIIAAAEESGFEGTWLGHDGFRGGFYLEQIQAIPSLADRFYINAYQVPIDEGLPETEDYVAAITEAYPDRDPSFGQPGWVTASILIEAVRETTDGGEPLTWEALRETLNTWVDKDVDAAIDLTYNDEFHTGATTAAVRLFDGEGFNTVGEFTRLPSAPGAS